MTENPHDPVGVRYLVDDVESAVDFYTSHLGFTLRTNFAPAFADVTRGSLREGRKVFVSMRLPDTVTVTRLIHVEAHPVDRLDLERDMAGQDISSSAREVMTGSGLWERPQLANQPP